MKSNNKYHIFQFEGKDVILTSTNDVKYMDVEFQKYIIEGLTPIEMDRFRTYIMSTKVPAINVSFTNSNTSNYGSINISFPHSFLPLKITGKPIDVVSIGDIELDLYVINEHDKIIEISSSSESKMRSKKSKRLKTRKHLTVSNSAGYDIEILEDYHICSLNPGEIIDMKFLVSIDGIFFCSNFVYNKIEENEEGEYIHDAYEVIMKSASYNLVEILQLKDIL